MAAAAERFQVSVATAKRWRAGGGRRAFAALLGLAASTVHRPLTRCGLARLRHLDRATGRVVRRNERATPGELVHVDIKKPGNTPDGGGHRDCDRDTGNQHRKATTTARYPHGKPQIGYSYLHNAVDDHSRLAYAEILPDETKTSAVAFCTRAQAFFASHGITVQRVLTDNGSCYRSRNWRNTLTAAGIHHTRTRPYRPQTNGKVQRFNRTLSDEWAYAQPYHSQTARRATLPGFLHDHNHHRHHTSIDGPPATRSPNLTGKNN